MTHAWHYDLGQYVREDPGRGWYFDWLGGYQGILLQPRPDLYQFSNATMSLTRSAQAEGEAAGNEPGADGTDDDTVDGLGGRPERGADVGQFQPGPGHGVTGPHGGGDR